ncbi:hypothetical protein, partial [Streptomyces albidoflavus]|uniref:hypothetical protein n=1 Tax=Streptomyces albidoflavus TaxID=1886 RepID=UPI001C3EC512
RVLVSTVMESPFQPMFRASVRLRAGRRVTALGAVPVGWAVSLLAFSRTRSGRLVKVVASGQSRLVIEVPRRY